MSHEVYFSKKSNQHYYTGLMPCNKCNHLIEQLIFIERTFSKTQKKTRYFCRNCVTKRQQIPSIYWEITMCVMTETLPRDAVPIFEAPPVLSSFKGSEDVFFTADKNRDGERVIDRAINSRNPNFMKMEGVKTKEQLLEDINKKDKKIMLEDLNKKKRG